MYKFSPQLVDSILNYLAKQKYVEVFQLINEIQRIIQVTKQEEAKSKEITNKVADKITKNEVPSGNKENESKKISK